MRCMISCFCAAVVLAAASTANAQPSDTKPASQAHGLMRVICDPASGLEPQAIVSPLLVGGALTRQVIAKAFPDVVKESPKVEVSVALGGFQGGLTASLYVKSYDERVPAEKMLAPLAEALADKLRELDVGQRRDTERLKQCELEADEAGRLLYDERESIEKLSGAIGYVPQQLAEQRLLRVEAAAQAATIELEGLSTRRETLERQIAAQATRVEEGTANDPVVKELEKVVDIRRAQRVQAGRLIEKNVATTSDMLQADAALAESRAELAKYQRAAAQSAGGERLAELQRRMEDTETQFAEAAAKRKLLVEQLDEAREQHQAEVGSARAAQAGSAELELKKLRIQVDEQRYRDMMMEINKLRAKLRSYQPPQVTIIPTS